MLKFKKIELKDFDNYKKYFHNTEELSCENAFVNLLVWQCTYNNMIAECDGQLFIKSGMEGKESFKLPVGGNLIDGIKKIEEYCGDKKIRFWAQQGKRLEEFLVTYEDEYIITPHRDAFDYIYRQEDLANLSGKKYHSKRNHISAFSKKYDWCYKRITEGNIDEIKKLADLWYNQNSHRLNSSMECERNGVNTILSNFSFLQMKGGAIYINDTPVAFTLGSEISPQIFDIHIEKALPEFGEAYTVINQQFVKNELADYEYINREDDMGLEGLRKAKLSYKPEILLEKYSLERKI